MTYLKNKFRVLLLTACSSVILSTASSPAQAEAKEVCRQYAVQPKIFNKLKLLGYKQLKNKSAGVHIKYGFNRHFVSIFKYDSGQLKISDEFLQARLKSSKNALEKAVVKRKDKILRPAKSLVWKMGDTIFYGVVYQVTYKKHKLKAYEYVGLSHNSVCMLKLRLTDALKTKASTSLIRFKSYVKKAHELFE